VGGGSERSPAPLPKKSSRAIPAAEADSKATHLSMDREAFLSMTPLTLRGKIEMVVVLLTLAGAALGFSTWRQEHDDRIRAEASVAAQQKAFDTAAAQMSALRAEDAERAKQTVAQVAEIQKAAAAQMTPAQIAAWLPKQAGTLPQPITIQVPTPTASNPTPAAIASIPLADLQGLRDSVEKCQECSVKLASAQGDLSSRDQQLKQAGEELSAVSAERDAYKVALKGGTTWQRFKRRAKDIVAIGAPIGAAVAIGAVCGTGHCK